jgi:hypothetical protein
MGVLNSDLSLSDYIKKHENIILTSPDENKLKQVYTFIQSKQISSKIGLYHESTPFDIFDFCAKSNIRVIDEVVIDEKLTGISLQSILKLLKEGRIRVLKCDPKNIELNKEDIEKMHYTVKN